MLNRSSILALAAVATLGVAALAPTSASALGGRGFGGHSFGGGHAFARVGHVNFARTAHLNFRPGIRLNRFRVVNHHWNWRWRRHIWLRPVITTGVVGTTGYAAYSATRPAVAAAPCNCLTKEYMQDGSVVFKDLCTKEMAINSPADQQAQMQPQGQPN